MNYRCSPYNMGALTFFISIFPNAAYAQSSNEISIVSDASKLDDKVYDPNP